MRWRLDSAKLLAENMRLREQLALSERARATAAKQATEALARERFWQHRACLTLDRLRETELFLSVVKEPQVSRSNACHAGQHWHCAMSACLCRCHTPPKARSCPVCGEPPGEGFLTYCGVEHMMFRGVARGS